jgi:hypothetical protein
VKAGGSVGARMWLRVKCATKRRLGRKSMRNVSYAARVVAAQRHSQRHARMEEIAEARIIVTVSG